MSSCRGIGSSVFVWVGCWSGSNWRSFIIGSGSRGATGSSRWLLGIGFAAASDGFSAVEVIMSARASRRCKPIEIPHPQALLEAATGLDAFGFFENAIGGDFSCWRGFCEPQNRRGLGLDTPWNRLYNDWLRYYR